MAAAAALANALTKRTSLSLAETTTAIKEVIPEHAEAVRAREHLESVGFIHMRADEFTGRIPSLPRYAADQAPQVREQWKRQDANEFGGGGSGGRRLAIPTALAILGELEQLLGTVRAQD